MQRWFLILPVLSVGLIAWMLNAGLYTDLVMWASAWQRDFQNGLAAALRSLRAKEPGALAWMMALCFAYGFAHAVGPGHGKVLIGGYGVGRRVNVMKLSGIALLSSLGQAVTAVVLVYGALLVLGWDRLQMTDAAENMLSPASLVAIGAVGVWLAGRGALKLRRKRQQVELDCGHHHGHGNDHHHDSGDGHCQACGHRHGPTLDEVESAAGLRDSLVLIGSIAIRPCTGALFLLLLTWHMGIPLAGVAGAFAMAAGTAAVTVSIAVASTLTRESTLLSFGDAEWARALMPWFEVGAGTLIAITSVSML
ncbi:nickel/cobalt transporter [Pseudoruegeria sp. HB172150]|uniref:nickel/cobalt transporter n=1 Tax=Pseudoruegeria sp. HB172150 TaxID=2721164 RepID=UPI001557D1DE|nr:hypothetical protein [Pseudoruegeria sp. HB172150]